MTAFVTKPAPDFTADAVVGGEFKTLKLSDFRGKYVVLFFYPLDFTFVCPTEIIAFSDAESLASAFINAVSAGAPIASRTEASLSRLRPAMAHLGAPCPA